MRHLLTALALAVAACTGGTQEPESRIATGVSETLTAWPTEVLAPSDTPPPSPAATLTFEPTPTIETVPPLALPEASGAGCIPQDTIRQVARVVSITDGDTIRVDIEGTNYPLRYIGMDTPEPAEPYGSTAMAANRELVEGKTVILVKDLSESDVYDRLLRYVIADGVFVNYELVRQGQAQAVSYAPDTACFLTFLEAETGA